MSDSCCSIPAVSTGPESCPRCGQSCRSVDRLTVAAVTTGWVPPNQAYRICRTPDCDVVYFGEDGTEILTDSLGVLPAFKSELPRASVCYCFEVRRRDIAAALAAGTQDAIPERIAAEVKADNCACEVRNPTGKCCLGEVRETITDMASSVLATC